MGFLDRLAWVQEGITRDRQDLDHIKFAQENQRRQSRNISGRITSAKVQASKVLAEHVERGTMPEHFQGNQAAWAEFRADVDFRASTERGNESLTPSDIYKIQGKRAAIEYLNDTNLAPTYLGEGRYLDETNTEFGDVTLKDGTTKFGILPKIRTVDVDAEGGPTIHSADATYNGRKLRDIYAESGDKGVAEATVGGLPMDFIDKVDADHGQNVSERGGSERNFGLLSGSDFGFLQDPETSIEERRAILERAYDKSVGEEERLTGELERIEGEMTEEDKLYKEAQAAYTNPQTGELQPGAGAFPEAGTWVPDPDRGGSSLAPPLETFSLPTGADVNKKVDTLEGLFKSGGAFFEGDSTGSSIAVEGRTRAPSSPEQWKKSKWSRYTKVPGTYAFNATEKQWNQMGVEGRERATSLEKRILEENAKRWRQDANSRLRARYSQHKSAIGSVTNVQDLETDKQVKDFYAAHMNTGKLQNLFNAKPEFYQEYKNDPYEFAKTHMNDTNKLYGLPVTSAERNTILEAAAGANLSVVQRAIETRDTETLLAEIAKVKKLSEGQQKKLVEFNTIRSGDHYRYDKPVRAATVIAYAASLDRDHPVFKALTDPTVLSTYLETANFSLAQDTLRQKAEATQVRRDQVQFNWTKYLTEEATRLASGAFSQDGRAFHDKYTGLMDSIIAEQHSIWDASNPMIEQLGIAIQNEAGRLAVLMDPISGRDKNLQLPENRNDFASLVRAQAQIIKNAIVDEATPDWFLARWLLPTPNSEIFELNANVDVLDQRGEAITDPRRAKEAWEVREISSGDIHSIEKYRDDFSISAITYLITTAKARELGIE